MLYVLFDPFVALSLVDFHDLQLLMGTGEFCVFLLRKTDVITVCAGLSVLSALS